MNSCRTEKAAEAEARAAESAVESRTPPEAEVIARAEENGSQAAMKAAGAKACDTDEVAILVAEAVAAALESSNETDLMVVGRAGKSDDATAEARTVENIVGEGRLGETEVTTRAAEQCSSKAVEPEVCYLLTTRTVAFFQLRKSSITRIIASSVIAMVLDPLTLF